MKKQHRRATRLLSPRRLLPADLCSIADLSQPEIAAIMELAHAMKASPSDYRFALDARQMVMFFEKASAHTVDFEAGMNTLGGSAIFVDRHSRRS